MKKIKARWATASDPDKGRHLQDSKGEGVIPLEPVPDGFRADHFDGVFLHGTVPENSTKKALQVSNEEVIMAITDYVEKRDGVRPTQIELYGNTGDFLGKVKITGAKAKAFAPGYGFCVKKP